MKYNLTTNTKVVNYITLYQIEALIDIPSIGVNKGDLGGWIEKESNLSQEGNSWVCENAVVCENARVSGNSWVSGKARVYGDAVVSGDAWVFGNAVVCENARVYENARVSGKARVYGDAVVSGDAWVYGNAKIEKTSDYMTISSLGETNRTITITFTDKMIVAGCFRGNLDEFKQAVDYKYNGKGNYYTTIKYITELFENIN